MRTQLKVVVVVLAVLAFAGIAQEASACTQPPPDPPEVWVIFHEICCDFNNPSNCRIKAWIILHNFRTFGGQPGQFCACAFNRVGPILSVDRLQIVDQITGDPLEGFCFDQNKVTGAEVGPNAQGFLAGITQAIPSGRPVDLHFEVTLRDGTTFDQLAAALKAQGFVVTDEGNPDGSLSGGHFEQRPMGEIMDGTPNGTAEPTPLVHAAEPWEIGGAPQP